MYGLTNYKEITDIEVKFAPPEQNPTIGKMCTLDIFLTPKENYFFKYALFELINERTDKRASSDRITSRSNYLYRFNIENDIEKSEEEKKYTFQLRVPVHKEASRDDKFICIKWKLALQMVMTKSEEDNELMNLQAETIELNVE